MKQLHLLFFTLFFFTSLFCAHPDDQTVDPKDAHAQLNLIIQSDQNEEPWLLADASRFYMCASDETKKKFITDLSQATVRSLPEILNRLNIGHKLTADLCKMRIETEEEFDLDARLELAQALLKSTAFHTITGQDIHEADDRLCEVPDQFSTETKYGLDARRDAWLFRAVLAYTRNDYENSIVYYFKSLLEQRNVDIEKGIDSFPEHIRFEMEGITYLLKNHPCCKAKVDELLTEHIKDKNKQYFLSELFSIAWKDRITDGAWLLAQHNKEHGYLENAMSILDELNKQEYPNAKTELDKIQEQLQKQLQARTFNTLWKKYISTQSEKDKDPIENMITECMNTEEQRENLLKSCTTKEQKTYLWHTIFKKAQEPLKFKAAFQQAQITDDIQRKLILLQIALTNGIQEAAGPAFEACKEAGFNRSTKMLWCALAKHAPNMHMELITWLKEADDTIHALALLKDMADMGNVDAQLAYGIQCQKQYYKAEDRNAPEIKEQALHYLGKATKQPKKYPEQYIQARLELSYIAKAGGDLDKAKEMVRDSAHNGHVDSQVALAYYFNKEASQHAKNAQKPPPENKQQKNTNPILRAKKQVLDWYGKAVRNQNCSPERRIDLYREFVSMHLELADVFKVRSKYTKIKAEQKRWHQLSENELNAAQEKLDLILKTDGNDACALRQQALIHEQYGEREQATELLLKACKSDPAYQQPFTDLIIICHRYLSEIDELKEHQEAEDDSQATSLMKRTEQLAKKLTKMKPNFGDAWTIRGMCADRTGQIPLAVGHFQTGIKHDSARAHFSFANMYREGKHPSAKQISLRGSNAGCNNFFLGDQTNDPAALQKAAELYKQGLNLDSDCGIAWYGLGLINFVQGNDKQAINCCQKSAHLGQASAHALLAQYMMAGYGGHSNLEDAMWKLINVQSMLAQESRADIKKEAKLFLKLAQCGAENYLDRHAQQNIESFFALKDTPSNTLLHTEKQILSWFKSDPQLTKYRTKLAEQAITLLYRAINTKDNEDEKQAFYNQSQEAFIEVLHLDELNNAVTWLQSHDNLDKATQTEIQCACGLLHLCQANSYQDSDHYEQALKYLEQASRTQDIYNFNTARRMYFYASLLLDYPQSVLCPIDSQTEEQTEALKKAISLFEYITHEIAPVQPHNFFVGKAHAYLADIHIRVYNDKKAARAHYQEGAGFGHVICCLKLSQGYQTGSLTDDGKPDIHEAKRWLEKAVKDGHTKDKSYITCCLHLSRGYEIGTLTESGEPDIKEAKKWLDKAVKDGHRQNEQYATAQRDLWLLNRTLGQENKDKSAQIFLQMFDAIKHIAQEKKYESWSAVFPTWIKMNEYDKKECLKLISTKIEKNHEYYNLQQQCSETFPHLTSSNLEDQYNTLEKFSTLWNKITQEGKKSVLLAVEERDIIYAKIEIIDVIQST